MRIKQLKETFRFEYQMFEILHPLILYIGFAFLCGLLVAAIVAPVGCAVSPPDGMGFMGCMKAEFSQLF